MSALTIGLLIDFFLLAIGIYVFLYARGVIRFGDAEVRERAETFRKENATWMRLLGLALAAISVVNIVVHFIN